MAVPELVIADAPFKTYPGGVIALRCTDWLGPARGTLSTEVDARAITGEAVRDDQKVTTSIFSSSVAAFAEAEDTLVVDFSTLPLELGGDNDGMTYAMFISMLIEGDWDPTNNDTYRSSYQSLFTFGCNLGYFGGNQIATTEATFNSIIFKPRGLDHFHIVNFSGNWHIGDVDGTEEIHFRAYSRTGTTISWLLDQIFLVPYVGDFDLHGSSGWRQEDFKQVAGGSNDFGSLSLTDGTFVDGADGGDDNGKFTWMPFQSLADQQSDWSGQDGGGDFQKKSDYDDAEYMLRVVEDDFFDLWDSRPSPDIEPSTAHCYSACGQHYRPATTWVDDEFTRTVNWPAPTRGGSWGHTPEGFGWSVIFSPLSGGADPYAAVDGTKGIHRMGGIVGGTSTVQTNLGLSDTARALMAMADVTASGKFLVTGGAWFDGNTTAQVRMMLPYRGLDQISPAIFFDPIAETWSLLSYQLLAGAGTTLHGPVDISSWYAQDSYVGWKMELKRYLIRVKVWDATGAEPGAWDFEGFITLNLGGVTKTYDYDDNLGLTTEVNDNRHLTLDSKHNDAIAVWATHWDDILIEYDPYGDRDDVSIATERPHGTKVGEIVVPDGAQHLVYWGSRDWTDLDAFGDSVLAFSSRIWNDPGAAELQQARLLWYLFRSGRGGLIPMNWRSSTRKGVTHRILVGGG